MILLKVIGRLLEGLINAVNRYNSKKATDNPADTIANGSTVLHSDKTFTELSEQSKRDKPE